MKLAKPFSRLFSSSSSSLSRQHSETSTSINTTKELHAHLIRTQLHTDPSSISPVIRSYTLSPTHLDKAQLVFTQINEPTLPIFNFMIRALSQSNQPHRSLNMYKQMHGNGLFGDDQTFIFIFKTCGRSLNLKFGMMAHIHVLKLGYVSFLFVSNALIHMYGLCGDLGLSRKVFDEMSNRDLVSWNSLICGYSQCSKYREVLGLFDLMCEDNVKGDAVTMVKVLLASSHLGDKECVDYAMRYIEDNNVEIDVYLGNTMIDLYGRFGLVELARGVFDQMHERNIVSWNTMIMGYAKSGNLIRARMIFDDMPRRDVISWTSMIAGYCQCSKFDEAVMLFRDMMAAKVKPDKITVASVLSACAHLGLLDMGKAIHDYIREHDVKADVYVGNALIDMYCKCGSVEKAFEVFREMKMKDSVSWTAVIGGLAVNGFSDAAVDLFMQMLREGVRPTHGTFVGMLLACAHSGQVDIGLEYFEKMRSVYQLEPQMKHYGCVVDLLSRSGDLDGAYEFIKKMPIVPDVVVWRILLSACKLHGNVILAEVAANRLLELDPCNSGNYVLLSSTYAGADRWADAIRTRELMEDGDVPKPSGSSAIETDRVSLPSGVMSSLV
ncbi:Pentatricopeptide repeat [Dillenia turbinata]|uniref:Pentatricopeptide repeat n=1 Tax=Dillenia turbinata TaxID=194707 RepID=A0AAN8ZDA6_9MAGN